VFNLFIELLQTIYSKPFKNKKIYSIPHTIGTSKISGSDKDIYGK